MPHMKAYWKIGHTEKTGETGVYGLHFDPMSRVGCVIVKKC